MAKRYGYDDAVKDILAKRWGDAQSAPTGASWPFGLPRRPSPGFGAGAASGAPPVEPADIGTESEGLVRRATGYPGDGLAFSQGQRTPGYDDARRHGLDRRDPFESIQPYNPFPPSGVGLWGENSSPAPLPQYKIDHGFISEGEGGQRLDLYTLSDKFPNSGVTVATGVDLGSKSPDQLKAWGLSDQEIAKLSPYLGLRGSTARTYRAQHPFNIDRDMAAKLDAGAMNDTVKSIASHFDDANPSANFIDLPPQAQTVIADLAYNMGVAGLRKHPVWDDITNNSWERAIDKLDNWGGPEALLKRRREEAARLREALDATGLPR